MTFHAYAALDEACTAFGADLNANGRDLEAIQVVGYFSRVDLIDFRVIFFLLVSHMLKSHKPNFAVKVHIFGIQPIDFQVWNKRETIFAHFADEGTLAVHRAVVVEMDGVVAKRQANADDLSKATRVGDVNGTDVVCFGIKHTAWTVAEATGRHVPVADTELVFVASRRVELGKGCA